MTFKTPLKTFIQIAFCTALALAPCGFAVPVQANAAVKAFSNVPFETLGIGNESSCTKRALFAINDATEWQRVWGVHTSGIADAQSLPKVDFSRQTVIAVLSGERNDGKSLQIAQIVRGPQEAMVYFSTSDEKSWLDVAEVQTKVDEHKSVQPYVFVAVDKITTPVRFMDVFAAQNCSTGKCAV